MDAKLLWAGKEKYFTNDAAKFEAIKHYRDMLLSESDWTQLPDAVLTEIERTAWQDYRQGLRDVPQNFVNPDDVVFPTRP